MRKRWLFGTAVTIGVVAAGASFAAPRLLERLPLRAHADVLSFTPARMQRSYFARTFGGEDGARRCERLARAVRLSLFAIENEFGTALTFDPDDLRAHALDDAGPEWARPCPDYGSVRHDALVVVLSIASDESVRGWLASDEGSGPTLAPDRACRAYGRMIPYYSMAREEIVADTCRGGSAG